MIIHIFLILFLIKKRHLILNLNNYVYKKFYKELKKLKYIFKNINFN